MCPLNSILSSKDNCICLSCIWCEILDPGDVALKQLSHATSLLLSLTKQIFFPGGYMLASYIQSQFKKQSHP